jgi:hypothetical protein
MSAHEIVAKPARETFTTYRTLRVRVSPACEARDARIVTGGHDRRAAGGDLPDRHHLLMLKATLFFRSYQKGPTFRNTQWQC